MAASAPASLDGSSGSSSSSSPQFVAVNFFFLTSSLLKLPVPHHISRLHVALLPVFISSCLTFPCLYPVSLPVSLSPCVSFSLFPCLHIFLSYCLTPPCLSPCLSVAFLLVSRLPAYLSFSLSLCLTVSRLPACLPSLFLSSPFLPSPCLPVTLSSVSLSL